MSSMSIGSSLQTGVANGKQKNVSLQQQAVSLLQTASLQSTGSHSMVMDAIADSTGTGLQNMQQASKSNSKGAPALHNILSRGLSLQSQSRGAESTTQFDQR